MVERWPDGSGQFRRIRTLMISADERQRARLKKLRAYAVVVATPLDLIVRLEVDLASKENALSTVVVLAGTFAANRELATFLLEFYPSIEIVEGSSDADPETFLPSNG